MIVHRAGGSCRPPTLKHTTQMAEKRYCPHCHRQEENAYSCLSDLCPYNLEYITLLALPNLESANSEGGQQAKTRETPPPNASKTCNPTDNNNG